MKSIAYKLITVLLCVLEFLFTVFVTPVCLLGMFIMLVAEWRDKYGNTDDDT